MRGFYLAILAQDLVKIAEARVQDLVGDRLLGWWLHPMLELRCRRRLIYSQSSSFLRLVHFLELKFCGSQNGVRELCRLFMRMIALGSIGLGLIATAASILDKGGRVARQ